MTEPAPDHGEQERAPGLQKAVAMAVEHHRSGRLGKAEAIYERVLEAAPDHPDALHYLGVLRHQVGAGAEALRLLERAVEICPDHPDIRNNLGNVLKEQGRLEEAERAYRKAIEFQPEHADAHNNLATVLKRLGRFEEAEASCRSAISLAPGHAAAHHNLGNALIKLDRLEEAVLAFSASIRLKPDQSEAYASLVACLLHARRVEEALGPLREWLAHQPDHPIAGHLLASCTNEDVPRRASDAYVAAHFDDFAETFEKHLEALAYRGPELIGQAARLAVGEPAQNLEILDAGCGTGLLAPRLRPYARRLEGVDLSPAMIARARRRAEYDDLQVGELTAFLLERRRRYDLVALIDTLCYFGALEEPFDAAAVALRPAGHLIFTVEEWSDPEGGYLIRPHGRYCHTRRYVTRSLETAGYLVERIETEALRMEVGRPVENLVVTASLEETHKG